MSKFLDMPLYPQIVLVNFEAGLPGDRIYKMQLFKAVWVVLD
jgi:hypothetical protein